MKRIDTQLQGVCVLEPTVHGDHRGFFMETFNAKTYAELGITEAFVQDNHSCSSRGVLRGLHYQLGCPQSKLVRVVAGEVFDVAVDMRQNSPSFGHWFGLVLSAANKRSLFIPKGFAHGFYVLSDLAELVYKCSDYYAPSQERGIIWNDAEIGIKWPLLSPTPTLSAKDSAYPQLRHMANTDFFQYNPAEPEGL